MGFNVALALVEGSTGEALASHLDRRLRPDLTASGDLATRQADNGNAWAADIGGWAVLSDPRWDHIFEEDAWADLARSSRVMTLMLSSPTTSCMTAWYRDGACQRMVAWSELELVHAIGAELAEEAVAIGRATGEDGHLDLEAYAFALMNDLTGLSTDHLLQATFTALH